MINLELNGKTVEFKNQLKDISINDFQLLIYFFKKEYEEELDQYTDILSITTNLSKDELEEMNFTDLIHLINAQKDSELNNFKDTFYGHMHFKIGERKFESSSDGLTFEFSTKEMFVIKDLLANDPTNYIQNLAAVLFLELDEEGKRIKDYSKEKIKERAEIFKYSMDMDFISPYILKLAPYFVLDNVK